jgi:hypothetical protein
MLVGGTRARKPTKKRREAYHADLGRPEELPAYHSAFASGVKEGKPRIHQKDLPPPPRSWKELQRHRYAKEFKEAADKEYQSVNGRGTFEIVRKTPDIKVIHLTGSSRINSTPTDISSNSKPAYVSEETCSRRMTKTPTLQRLWRASFKPLWP